MNAGVAGRGGGLHSKPPSQSLEPAVSPREMGRIRWIAVEVFNGAPGLTDTARRLGINLVTTMDAKTRACFPSQERMADVLGKSLASIKRAKVELRRAGYITWSYRGSPRGVCSYNLNWRNIYAAHLALRDRIERNAAARKTAPKGELDITDEELAKLFNGGVPKSSADRGKSQMADPEPSAKGLTRGRPLLNFLNSDDDDVPF